MIFIAKKKRKNQKKNILIAAAVIVIAGIFLLTYGPGYNPGGNQSSLPTNPANCGDLQINVNSFKEAIAYYRFGIPQPSSDNYKFEIFDLTVVNKGTATEDFSGFRLNLRTNDGAVYIPKEFTSIEKITLPDNTTMDYACNELALASASRLILNPGESANGCKIYLILNTQTPSSFSIYDTSGLKCTIQI